MDIPKSGDVSIIAGISPIKALIKAVNIRDVINNLIPIEKANLQCFHQDLKCCALGCFVNIFI